VAEAPTCERPEFAGWFRPEGAEVMSPSGERPVKPGWSGDDEV